MDALNESRLVPDALQMIDSTVMCALFQAASVKRVPRQSFGRSRGGFTTKIQLPVNGASLPMISDISPDQISDYLGFDLVLAENLAEPSVLLADCGNGPDCLCKTNEVRNLAPVIPILKSRQLRVSVDRSCTHRHYRLKLNRFRWVITAASNN